MLVPANKPRLSGRQALCVTLVLSLGLSAGAATWDLDWFTIDAGGEMFSTGPQWKLGGTIGQCDAGQVLSGGAFKLTGGFWPGVPHGRAICRGDLNCDNQIDFNDINPFVLALSNWSQWLATYPDCPPKNADINGDGLYGGANGFNDINPFVALLSSGGGNPIPCP